MTTKPAPRYVKRKRSVFIPRVGGAPIGNIFPASARGKYRTGGNYGRYSGKGAEMKFIDNILATANLIAATGELRPDTGDVVTPAVAVAATGTLLQIAQGDQTYQRNGRKIVIKSIFARLDVTLPATVTAANGGDIYRIMLVLDTQCNGAAPAVTDVISYPGQTLSQMSYNNLENSERFRTLADVMRPINASAGGMAGATGSSALCSHFLKINKKCNIPVEYSTTATTGALATIKSNNIFLLAISRGGLVLLSGNVRIRYTDI